MKSTKEVLVEFCDVVIISSKFTICDETTITRWVVEVVPFMHKKINALLCDDMPNEYSYSWHFSCRKINHVE